MRRRDFYWSLHHRERAHQLDDLKTEQVEAIFEALLPSQHLDWLIWKEGFKNWKSFSEFPVLLEDLRNAPQLTVSNPPPVPPLDMSIEDIERAVETVIDNEFRVSYENDGTPPAGLIADSLTPRPSMRPAPSVAVDLPPPAPSSNVVLPKTPPPRTAPPVVASLGSVSDAPSPKPTRPPQNKMPPKPSEAPSPFGPAKTDQTQTSTSPGLSSALAASGALTTARPGDHLQAENRKAVRYDAKFEARIKNPQGGVFRTLTVNVSMNGLQLQDPLPDWVSKYVMIELSAEGGTIPLLCSRVKSAAPGPQSRLRIESNDNCEILRRWLLGTSVR